MLSVSARCDGRYTILVSDDDPGVRRSVQLLLRSRGYKVYGYTTGRALLADPRANEADCVILDYRMGHAIMISGFHDVVLAQRAAEAGFDHIIAKPLIGRALLDAVGQHSAQNRRGH